MEEVKMSVFVSELLFDIYVSYCCSFIKEYVFWFEVGEFVGSGMVYLVMVDEVGNMVLFI